MRYSAFGDVMLCFEVVGYCNVMVSDNRCVAEIGVMPLLSVFVFAFYFHFYLHLYLYLYLMMNLRCRVMVLENKCAAEMGVMPLLSLLPMITTSPILSKHPNTTTYLLYCMCNVFVFFFFFNSWHFFTKRP